MLPWVDISRGEEANRKFIETQRKCLIGKYVCVLADVIEQFEDAYLEKKPPFALGKAQVKPIRKELPTRDIQKASANLQEDYLNSFEDEIGE